MPYRSSAVTAGVLGCVLLVAECLAAPAAVPAPEARSVESSATPSVPGDVVFESPAALAPQVAFWTRVYVEIDTGAGFVHDNRHLDVVYETVRVSAHRATRRTQSAARKRHWKKVLQLLSTGIRPASNDARRAVALWRAALDREPVAKDFEAAADRLRFQLGQRNRFQAGLVRSGRFEARIRTILAHYRVPSDLAYLPHVESSFNTYAYSKSGAAGMWQFMPGTGRRFMRVDTVVDERLAPIKASHAAAKLLRANYERLGSWPLAITAYNHGANGMARAKRAVGTTDIVAIIERYDGRRFGFASRNFYAQFLAARNVARSSRQHFGELELDRPEPIHVVTLPFYADSRDVLASFGIASKVLATLNPSLRSAVHRSEKYIPAGFELRVPTALSDRSSEQLLAAIPPERRYAEQRRPRVHIVRRGETLGRIARRHGTTVARLVALNGLRSAHRIRVGQRLELATPAAPRAVAVVTRSAPKPKSARVKLRRAKTTPATMPRAASTQPIAANATASSATAARMTQSSDPVSPWRRLDGDHATVDHRESLVLFARWLDVTPKRLRELNTLRGSALRLGQRLKLDFSNVSAEEFERRRSAHHREVEVRFFASQAVTGTVDHTVKKGESMWHLANKIYKVPAWLLHRYNPQTRPGALRPGMQVKVPVLGPVTEI